MRGEYGRSRRVQHLLEELFSELLLRKIKDPRVVGVTITGVRLTPDMRHATIYIGTGRRSRRGEEEALAGVRSAVGLMRSEAGRQLKMRYTPELAVEIDTSLGEAEKIEKLLARVRGEMGPRPPEADESSEAQDDDAAEPEDDAGDLD